MAQEYGLSPHWEPRTPGGLLKKQNIRRFTAELFNSENDHNPTVARPCLHCNGKGFYRTGVGSARHDRTCEECHGVGAFEETAQFFEDERLPIPVTPNSVGSVRCPNCSKIFPITSNQYWTGLRHECGQKLVLEVSNAWKCWTRQQEV
jgi:hypothetical protein